MSIFEPKHEKDDVQILRGYILTFKQNWDDDSEYRKEIMTLFISLLFIALMFLGIGFALGRFYG